MNNVSLSAPPQNPSTRLQIPIWLFIILLWGLFTALLILISVYNGGTPLDFEAYYRAAQRLNAGYPLYIPIDVRFTYLYPPLFAQMLAPFEASLSVIEVITLWVILNIFCLLFATLLIASQIRHRWKRYVTWLLPLLFLPFIDTFIFGQIVPILLLLITGAMVAYKHNHPILAGGLLAIATWLKIYPLLIILYFILRRDWWVVISAFVVGIILLCIQINISGLDLLVFYFTDTLVNLASHGQNLILGRNHSIFGFTHRLFIDHSTIAKISQLGITGVMIVIMVVTGKKPWHQKLNNMAREDFDLEYGMTLLKILKNVPKFMKIMG